MIESQLLCVCNKNAIRDSLSHAVVIFLRGPEADDGVDNRGGVHWGAAVDDGDEDSILLTVVATRKLWSREENC